MRLAQLLTHLYGLLLRMYPTAFRMEFEAEMRGVFADSIAETAPQGHTALARMYFRELHGWLRTMSAEHVSALRPRQDSSLSANEEIEPTAYGTNGRYGMDVMESNGSWGIESRREIILTVLPPLILGLGIMLSSLIFGGESFRTLPQWRFILSAIMLFGAAAAIATGGIIAIARGLPDWGYTWVGAFLMGVVFAVIVIADEASESGGHIISPGFETGLGVLLVLLLAAALFTAALRGWQRAGLVSIGMAATLALGMCGTANAAPFYRYDLASLSIVLAALTAVFIYVYISQSDFATQITVFVAVAVLNALFIWIVGHAWQEWLVERGKPSQIVPMVVLPTLVLLSGPVVGLLTRSVRPLLNRA